MAAVTIRPAAPSDATHLACFVDMASGGMALRLWESVRGPHQTLFEVGRSRALREDGAFSYRNAAIAEAGGAVAGGLVGYVIARDHDGSRRAPGPGEAAKLPSMVRPLVELEALVPGHWYVNILATYPEYRGQGIGTALLSHAEGRARAAGSSEMALIVASGEEPAQRLYAAVGYRERARRPQAGTTSEGAAWVLMTKPIDSA
jgi:ribosomal protein S18 acetylase RimI-like enzyme